ncbi:MAG: hypothetical protein Ct9H300mP27_03420 [Chloroflexota bacterium]|nr:MAG: hypothetical protein Ct9H300mP27_03420 [Chloroflexota bacterium]
MSFKFPKKWESIPGRVTDGAKQGGFLVIFDAQTLYWNKCDQGKQLRILVNFSIFVVYRWYGPPKF